MSLPTTKATQSSIRSFFQPPKAPKYAPPPSQASQQAVPPPPPAPPAQPPAPSPQAEPATAPPTMPTPPPPTNIPSEATIRPIQEQDIPALRRINALLLPVAFHDALYQTALDSHTSGPFSRVITWAHEGQEAKVVGSIIAILEPALTSGGGSSGGRVPQTLYIRSLSLLSPYRSLGLANAALEHVVATALSASHLDVRTVTAHVWTENDEGLHWYESRGFERDDYPIQGYYLKLRPGSAWLVQRPIQASVASSLPSAPTAASAARQPAPSTTAAIVNLPPMSSTGTATPPPPPPSSSSRPKGQSFQNQRSETEWNDLPADMMGPGPALLGPSGRKLANGNGVGSEPGSSGSSRSSSVTGMKKKRDRSYPAAAFGSGA